MSNMCLSSFKCGCELMGPLAGPFRGWSDHRVNLDDFSSLEQ
jgi:hypothetical protein